MPANPVGYMYVDNVCIIKYENLADIKSLISKFPRFRGSQLDFCKAQVKGNEMKIVVTNAVNGSGPIVNPALPITPSQIADSALEAAKAGAAVVHIHARDPETGKPSVVGSVEERASFREIVERIRERNSDLIINLTTGPGGNFVLGDPDPSRAGPGSTLTTTDRRMAHVEELRPEICSLDMGSMDKGKNVYINAEKHVRESLRRIQAVGVKPEMEIFDAGHLLFARSLLNEGLFEPPPIIQICLGMIWGAPATTETMLYLRGLLPPDAVWMSFGKDLAQFPMIAQTVLLGGHVRVGLEDTAWIEPGELAPSNAALVDRTVKLLDLIHASPASPNEARQILGLKTSTNKLAH
jgi:uncharacterized protein (DUF849 family)